MSGYRFSCNIYYPYTSGYTICSSGAGPTVLYPQRSSSSGKQLMDAATLVTYTDSGAPNYAYDGTSGSTTLSVESWIAEHDVVGVPKVWDWITNTEFGTIGGNTPSNERANGFGAMVWGTDTVTGMDLSDSQSMLIEWTNPATLGAYTDLLQPLTEGIEFTIRSNLNGRIVFSVWSAGGRSGTIWVTKPNTTPVNFVGAAFIARTGVDTYDCAIFDSVGTVIQSVTGTHSSTGIDSVSVGDQEILNGRGNAANTPFLQRVRTWSSAITIAEATDVMTGATTSGWNHDLKGVASGAYNAAAPLELPIETAATGDVTAEYI